MRLVGTQLPPNLLLVGKLLFLSLLLRGHFAGLSEPFLPFWRALDGFPWPGVFRTGLQLALISAGLCLLLNRWVRGCCIVLGVGLWLGVLADRGSYLNATFYCTAIFLLLGLYERRTGRLFLRLQLAVMYFGSAVNKILEEDWRSGRYMDHWLGEIVSSRIYSGAAEGLPEGFAALALSWGTILFEAYLMVGFLVPSWTGPAVVVALCGHTLMVLLGGTTFGVFYSALAFSFLIFVPWPSPGTVLVDRPEGRFGSAIERWGRRLDPDALFRWRRGRRLQLSWRGRRRGGALLALVVWLGVNPWSYFFAAVLLATVAPIAGRLLSAGG